MRKIFKIFAQAGVVALLGFGLFKSYEFYKQNQLNRLQALKIASSSDKYFVVVIPSHNSSRHCERNLFSILTQNYSHFRVVYIDDGSDDNTYEKAKKIISTFDSEGKVQLIRNEQRKGPLANLFEVAKASEDYEVILIVEGDDFLAHENVLSKLNRIYSTTPTWMTYGNFLDYPSYKQMPVKCKPYSKNIVFNNSYRSHEFIMTHLRTFYAGLFKLIREEDLFYNGRFVPAGWDMAVMVPLLEMSGKHAHFVNEVLYLYNRSTPSVDLKTNPFLLTDCINYIKKLPKYKRLKRLPFETSPPSLEPKEVSISQPSY